MAPLPRLPPLSAAPDGNEGNKLPPGPAADALAPPALPPAIVSGDALPKNPPPDDVMTLGDEGGVTEPLGDGG